MANHRREFKVEAIRNALRGLEMVENLYNMDPEHTENEAMAQGFVLSALNSVRSAQCLLDPEET